MKNSKISRMIKIALLAALVSTFSYITIPIPPIPFTAQTLGVMLVGLLLSPIDAIISISIFILLGTIGIPVFSGGSSGIGILFGPTGGYIFGFLLCAAFISYFKGDGKNLKRNLIVTLIGGIGIVYLVGVPWLAHSLNMNIAKAIQVGAIPFLIGDIIKIILASIIGVKVNKSLRQIANN
ncbi:MAG: biotin transporter BioY [Bacillota bacterium]|nr:biotin transporter BioY [Bacillota bacterium]